MKYHIGQRVIINTKNGEGIYDGAFVYIRGWSKRGNETAYLVSETRSEPTRGFVKESHLLHATEWQFAHRIQAERDAQLKAMFKEWSRPLSAEEEGWPPEFELLRGQS